MSRMRLWSSSLSWATIGATVSDVQLSAVMESTCNTGMDQQLSTRRYSIPSDSRSWATGDAILVFRVCRMPGRLWVAQLSPGAQRETSECLWACGAAIEDKMPNARTAKRANSLDENIASLWTRRARVGVKRDEPQRSVVQTMPSTLHTLYVAFAPPRAVHRDRLAFNLHGRAHARDISRTGVGQEFPFMVLGTFHTCQEHDTEHVSPRVGVIMQ